MPRKCALVYLSATLLIAVVLAAAFVLIVYAQPRVSSLDSAMAHKARLDSCRLGDDLVADAKKREHVMSRVAIEPFAFAKRDPWGRFYYAVMEKGRLYVVSYGCDGVHSEDDIGTEVIMPAGEDAEGRSPSQRVAPHK